MISKSTIAEIRALHRQKVRHEKQLFIAEGVKVVTELLQSSFKVTLVVCVPEFLSGHRKLLRDVEVIVVTEKEISRISTLQTPNQVVAIAGIPENHLPHYRESKKIMLVLDGIRDPGNMGTLIRTSEWFGVHTVICSDDCVDVYNPKVVQGAMGSLFRMEIGYAGLEEQLKRARQEGGYQIIGASADGTPYRECNIKEPWMLVIGSESHGISSQLNAQIDIKAAIPRAQDSKTESLNAAVAASILLASLIPGR